ncbi:MAG: hypothetical protein DI533_10225 [Cereibacter sphaeroides]|uniref:Isoprenylcysteine carboxylmethyltransferase family protein n=1 Tax=Cereibacter sphaeroides TaxID=1063 RepID=A0A2W5SF49_CERSP|nr:MAG: hypothetical protein DI533_10225 [Cereibacter sphaeroides]
MGLSGPSFRLLRFVFLWQCNRSRGCRSARLAILQRDGPRPLGRDRLSHGVRDCVLWSFALDDLADLARCRPVVDRRIVRHARRRRYLPVRAGRQDSVCRTDVDGRVGVASGASGDLVSDGLYRFSRNPTFVGQFMLLAGVNLAMPSIPTVLAPLLFLWSTVTQVRTEETILRASLGANYDRYAASVPRWIGPSLRSTS